MTQGPQLPRPTWFVGCGNMGSAIVQGWRIAGIDLSNLTVIDPFVAAIDDVRVVAELAEAGPPPRLVVLAVKPQTLDEVAAQLKPWLTSRATIVSILAGVEVGSLKQRFPNANAIVRVMPNLPAAVRRGVVGLYSQDADDATREQLGNLFAALGFAMWMADETKLAALGSLAGAGPAYAARFIDALAKAGERLGLTREIASTLALETVLGAAWMAATKNESMEDVARRVASPNGTTEAGLKVLDGDGALDELVARTIDAASKRGEELAAAAKAPSLAGSASLH